MRRRLDELGEELGRGALLRAVSQVEELLDAVLALVTLALLDALGALVKVVLERSAGFGLLALYQIGNPTRRNEGGALGIRTA